MKNPIQEIKAEQDWTLNEFSIACNVGKATIINLLDGQQKSIPDEVIETLDALYYDVDELKDNYQKFRNQKRKELLT